MLSSKLNISCLTWFGIVIGCSALLAPVSSDDGAFVTWRSIGPYGGDVRQVVIDPGNSKLVYVGTGNGQVYRSEDAGSSWSRQGLSVPGYSVDAMVFDPSEHRYLYAGVWSIDRENEGGILRSRDRGQTWRTLDGIRGHSVRALAQSESNPSILVAGALDGVFMSSDWGDSWARISPAGHPEIRNVESVAIHPEQPSMIFVGTWHLPWKTLDGGKTWMRAATRETGMIDDSDIFSILFDAKNHDGVFISACTGLYHSVDSGANWTKIRGIPSNSKRTRVVYQHPTRPGTLYAGTTEGLWRSDDGGSSWRLVSDRSLVVNDVAISPQAANVVYVATDQMGLMRSLDGGSSFTPSNEGLAGRPVATASRDPEHGTRLYAGLLQQRVGGPLWLSQDNGTTWRPSAKGLKAADVYCLHQVPEVPDCIIAGTSIGLFRSDDRGQSWSPFGVLSEAEKGSSLSSAQNSKAPATKRGQSRSGPASRRHSPSAPSSQEPPRPVLRDHIVQIAADQELPARLLVVGWRGLYRIDLGTGVAKFLFRSPEGSRALSVSGGLFEGSRRVFLGTSSGLHESSDGGNHWRAIDFYPGTHAIQVIAVSSGRTQSIYLRTDIGLLLRRSGDTSWMRKGGGLPPISVSAILINPTDDSEIWVADQRRGGIYFSRDAAENWVRVDSGLSDPRIWSLHFTNDERPGILAGSFGGGIYLGSLGSRPTIRSGGNTRQ